MRIVKVSAVWCSACLIMNKIWKEIETEEKLEVESLDLDMNEEEVKKYNVGEKLPEVIFLNDEDEEIGRLIGEHTKKEILEYMRGLNV
ncbi:MAG: thioredoxin family protein [Bacilli bacterium]|nr:thioredoxin family protein [Bacilli bacterium]